MLISGRYRLVKVLGAGGMGRVWLGHDELIGREVAIKELLLPSGITDEQRQTLTQRAMREARAAGRLNHPGIITVHDVIEHDGAPLIVMEFVRGRSLADAIKADGALPVERAAAVAGVMFAVLRVAHGAGIVHRDLKPGNVLLDGDRVVITDFGIASLAGEAQLTRSGMIMGTPAYMAPEQAEHERGSTSSDLWSVGATLYAALEGRPPFEGESVMAVLSAVLTREPRPPQRAGRLAPLLYALLRKDPNQRPTLDQAEQLLAPAAEGGPGSSAPAGGSEAAAQTAQLPSSPDAPPGVSSAPVPPRAYADHPPQPDPAATGATLSPDHSGLPKGYSAPPSRHRSGQRTAALIGGSAVAMVLIVSVTWLVLDQREAEQGSPPAAGSENANAGNAGDGNTGRPGTPVEITKAIQLTGHAHRITSVAFSPDGALLASTDDDLITGGAKTWLWNVGSGKRVATLVSPPGLGGSSVNTVAFSPDGKWLASGGNRVGDATTYLWRVADRHRVGPMTQSTSIMKSLAFSPDSKTIAGATNRGTVTIWDTATRRVKVGLPDGNGFRNVVLSPDGKMLANPGLGREVRLSDAATGRTVHTITDATGSDVAFSPDGKTLAVPDSDGTHSLRLYDVATGRSTIAFDRAEGDLVANVIYSPDGKTIASWGHGNVIRLWDVASRRIRANLIGHSGQVNSVAFSRDGKKIASGSQDKTIRIWNLSG